MVHKIAHSVPFMINERSFMLYGGRRWDVSKKESQIFELGKGFRAMSGVQGKFHGACLIQLEEGQMLKLGGWK